VNVPISVDTYKPEVARAAVAAGAAIINDTSGLADEKLATIAAETGAAIVVMHIPCHPKERIEPGYADPVGAISEFLREKAAIIEKRGVPPERIVIDPGIGFGKKPQENLKLIAHFSALQRLGYATLFACSRRTFLGNLMGGAPPEERLEATVAVNAAAVLAGADIIRVHDVMFMAKLAKMLGMIRAAE
jgi:dihydropteroate synthase